MPMIQATSCGRLFDVVGSLLGLGMIHTYDAQIAIALESLCGDEKGILLDYNYDGRSLDFTCLLFNLLWMVSLKVNLELILQRVIP